MKYLTCRHCGKYIEEDEFRAYSPINKDYICEDCYNNCGDEEFDSYESEEN